MIPMWMLTPLSITVTLIVCYSYNKDVTTLKIFLMLYVIKLLGDVIGELVIKF